MAWALGGSSFSGAQVRYRTGDTVASTPTSKGGPMEQATRVGWPAEAHEQAALEHEDMARQWLAVGERRHAEIELSRTTIHRRAAAIKRELAAAEAAGA